MYKLKFHLILLVVVKKIQSLMLMVSVFLAKNRSEIASSVLEMTLVLPVRSQDKICTYLTSILLFELKSLKNNLSIYVENFVIKFMMMIIQRVQIVWV